MDKKDGYTREEIEAYIRAISEQPIKAKNLLEEILPLLEEYFFGEFRMSGDELRVEMLNGQKFMISIREECN